MAGSGGERSSLRGSRPRTRPPSCSRGSLGSLAYGNLAPDCRLRRRAYGNRRWQVHNLAGAVRGGQVCARYLRHTGGGGVTPLVIRGRSSRRGREKWHRSRGATALHLLSPRSFCFSCRVVLLNSPLESRRKTRRTCRPAYIVACVRVVLCARQPVRVCTPIRGAPGVRLLRRVEEVRRLVSARRGDSWVVRTCVRVCQATLKTDPLATPKTDPEETAYVDRRR